MKVKTTQLVPGCIVLKNVNGPTGHAIVSENTVLSDLHITVLNKFLIETVDVSQKLVNGKTFFPMEQEETEQSPKPKINEMMEKQSVEDHYLHVVEAFKRYFKHWRNNLPIDIPAIRKNIIPLLMRVEELGAIVFRLQQFSTKEDYVYHHCVSVSLLSAYIGKKMNLPKNEWIQLGLAGLLSDSGMAKINAYYLENRSLTEQEIAEVKQHPLYSYRLVEKISTLSQKAKTAILQHHEKMDGSGYPHGIKGNQLYTYAQIIAICDTYHAMTCERMYASSTSPFKVIEQLQSNQYSKLDPKVITLFIDSLSSLMMGGIVKLSNDKIGEIVFINNKQPTRPMVQLIDNKEIIVLEKEPDLYIQQVIEK